MSQPTTVVLEWVMQLIPVIDLVQGRAVHARAGCRGRYAPVESALTPGRDGDPLALVQAYRDALGARECYLADLDAIQGGELQRGGLRWLIRAAAPCGLLVDAATYTAEGGRDLLALGAAAAVIGLETLPRLDFIGETIAAAPAERVIFSLDLRLGRPLLSPEAAADSVRPETEELASRAVDAGVGALMVLDVGRVGTGRGVDLELLRRLRRRFPHVRLLVGGGVAGPEDLKRLEEAGCDGALVASAIHAGRIGQSSTSASRQVADWP
jgi:phosphoribosylformimino-5-aminoimidazole carboxamide ribotide isomerase